jgi:hypothetical protein
MITILFNSNKNQFKALVVVENTGWFAKTIITINFMFNNLDFLF